MDPLINTHNLKILLDHLSHPEDLDQHPWVRSRLLASAGHQKPGLEKLSPGAQLTQTICQQFIKMMPAHPPRRGLRLDTRWGEFGILAAQYFAPYMYDLPYPTSLREAWQRIDQAILLFVFEGAQDISAQDEVRYQLIGEEPEVAPNSTISDWHRKGLERFTALLAQYEKHLETQEQIIPPQHPPGGIKDFFRKFKFSRTARVWMGRAALTLALGLLTMGLLRGWGLLQRTLSIKSQVEELLAYSPSLTELDALPELSDRVDRLRADLGGLQKESAPLLAASPYLGWLPIHGGDITQMPILLEMAVQMSIAGDEVLQAINPLVAPDAGDSSANLLSLVSELQEADTQLIAAQVALANVNAARQQLQEELLSPRIKDLLHDKIDPFLDKLEGAFPASDVLQMARLAPRLLGAVGNGPQTYLLLIQNEDELRPTGGFLTAVGILQVENGQLRQISFESSDRVDDLKKPYPKAPWQLDDYMMAGIFLLRDANWFADFPTTVEWVKFLYGYTRPQAIDGVIALNQHVVQELLRITGPLDVPGVNQPVGADSVLEFMRAAKQNTPPPGISHTEWDRKQFISWLAEPLMKRLLTLDSPSRLMFSRLMLQLLDEHHILLHFDDPEMDALVARSGWDGALRPPANSDFLMVVDSNVGFNKTNALLQTALEYTVDLGDMRQPTSELTVTFRNPSNPPADYDGQCVQAGGDIRDLPLDQRAYTMHDCYWSYLRVYTPSHAILTDSTPQDIPEEWHLREKYVLPRVDVLDENIPGTQAFGTLLVVPPEQSHQSLFTYQLPANIIQAGPDPDTYTYRLLVKKQPGTLGVPLTLRLALPAGAQVLTAPPNLQASSGHLVLMTNLRQDIDIEVTYQVPE